MNPITKQSLRDRLDRLRERGVIAGWQDGGRMSTGLRKTLLPALIFPVNGGPAAAYYSEASMENDAILLQIHGPMLLRGDRCPHA